MFFLKIRESMPDLMPPEIIASKIFMLRLNQKEDQSLRLQIEISKENRLSLFCVHLERTAKSAAA